VAAPSTIGPCPSTASPLDCLTRRVEALAAAGVFHGQIVVSRDGAIAWEASYGKAPDGAAMTARSRLDLASVGKMFTAVAVGQLVDDGRMAFSDAIGSYVDGLPDDVAESTIAELLSHTAGLSMYDWKLGRTSPKGEFRYSNAGFDLLDLAVEQVSGVPVAEYQSQHIVQRSGMLDTRWETEPGASTARDMLKFVQALFANRLMARGTTTKMTTAKVATSFGGYGYGFGIFTGDEELAPSVGHIGVAPGAVAVVEYSPAISTAIVLLSREGFAEIQPALIEYQQAIGMGYWRG
jgi:CubicO group peptidase (beta-lactamase class C family)